MLKATMFTALLALPLAAHAQGDVTDGTPATTATTATTAATDQFKITGEAPPVFKQGTLGLSFGIPAGGAAPGYAVSIVDFVDDHTAYDLLVGFDFHRTDGDGMAMPAVKSGTTTALTAGLGYRLYKHHTARVHTYLEPAVVLSSADLGGVADNLTIGAGASLGVECMFTEWFSVRGQAGAQLAIGKQLNNIELTTATSGLYANMYWN
jgi:hypothetical protein